MVVALLVAILVVLLSPLAYRVTLGTLRLMFHKPVKPEDYETDDDDTKNSDQRKD